jgi:hypothetical protein
MSLVPKLYLYEDVEIMEKVYRYLFEQPTRSERLQGLREDINKLSFQEMKDKYLVSDNVLKRDIRVVIQSMDINQQIDLLKKFGMKVSAELRREQIKQYAHLSAEEISIKVGISIRTVRKYLKEIFGEKTRIC